MAVLALIFSVISFTRQTDNAASLATRQGQAIATAYLSRVELEALGFYRMIKSKFRAPPYVAASDLDPTTAELGAMIEAKAPISLVRDFQNLHGQVSVVYGAVFGGHATGPLLTSGIDVICRHGHGAYGIAVWALRVGGDLRLFLPRNDTHGIDKTAERLSHLCADRPTSR